MSTRKQPQATLSPDSIGSTKYERSNEHAIGLQIHLSGKNTKIREVDLVYAIDACKTPSQYFDSVT
jgi:hypothetical protein